MNNPRTQNSDFEMYAWGLLLIWWGLRGSLLVSLPNGAGLLGSGLILLGLNAARSRKGLPAVPFTSLLGILALAFGGLMIAREVLHLSFEIPAFEISLILLGIALIIREYKQIRRQSPGAAK